MDKIVLMIRILEDAREQFDSSAAKVDLDALPEVDRAKIVGTVEGLKIAHALAVSLFESSMEDMVNENQ